MKRKNRKQKAKLYEQKYGLDKLINDESEYVRAVVIISNLQYIDQ